MQLPHDGILLCSFIGETDRYQGKPLYEWIVLQAREQGLVTLEKVHIKYYRFE